MAKNSRKLFDTAIVEKRNILNELRSKNMTLQELRFFSIYLSKINPLDESTRAVRFPLEDFKRIMDFGNLNLTQLRNTFHSLLQHVVDVPNENGRGFTSFQLFKKCRLTQEDDEYGEWYVEIDAHDDALPLMFGFKDRYFKYELWNALRLKSKNQIRMYEILKQYEKLRKREILVSELRQLLGIDNNEYSGTNGWAHFRRCVLDSCQRALRESTDICFTYERGKVGRGGKWLSVIFHIRKNKNHVDPLSLNEFITGNPEPLTIEMDEDDMRLETYGSETLVILAEAVDNEFTRGQMEQIFAVLTRIHVPKDPLTNDITFGRQAYLREKYASLNAESERKEVLGARPIKNRFKYFMKMLEEDTFQPASYEEDSGSENQKF